MSTGQRQIASEKATIVRTLDEAVRRCRTVQAAVISEDLGAAKDEVYRALRDVQDASYKLSKIERL